MIKDYTDKLVKIIHTHLPGCKIYLFDLKYDGKEDKQTEASIAIDAGAMLNPAIFGNIYSDIKKEYLPFIFHIIDLEKATQETRDKVMQKGVKLHHDKK